MNRSEKREQQQAFEFLQTAFEEQLADPNSPEVKAHYYRLLALGIDERRARVMIMMELSRSFAKMREEENFDYAEYVARLAQLPESVQEERSLEAEDDARPRRPINQGRKTRSDVMNDDFYRPILFAIEGRIIIADRQARERNILINDSQVRSILNKVRKAAEGGTPKLPEGSERDKVLASIYDELLKARKAFKIKFVDAEYDEGDEGEDLPASDWILCLRTVEESVQTHNSGPGSRAYLEFLDKFIPAKLSDNLDPAPAPAAE